MNGKKGTNRKMKYSLKYFKISSKKGFMALFLVSLTVGAQIIIPLFVRRMYDEVSDTINFYKIISYLVLYALILFGYNILDVIRYRALDRYAGEVLFRIRHDMMYSLYHASYDKILLFGKEKIKNVLYTDTLNIFSCAAVQIVNIFTHGVLLVLFILISFSVNWKIGGLLFLAAIGSFLIAFFSRGKIRKKSAEVNKEMKEDNKFTNEYVELLETVKINGLFPYCSKKVEKQVASFIDTSIMADKTLVFLKNLMEHFHQWVSFLLSVVVISSNPTRLGNLLFLLFVLEIILNSSRAIEDGIFQLIRQMPAFHNVSEIINMYHSKETETIDFLDTIVFENVSFSYGEKDVIKNLSARFQKGDIVHLVGGNGAGKSTMVRLLSGLMEPTGGKIYFNGKNITAVSLEELHKNILYAAQDELLLNEDFYGYLKNVIPELKDEKEIDEVLAKLHLAGDNRSVEDLGMSLSGGQRKKLLLAKLIIRSKYIPIIILDELETAMDYETKQIFDEFKEKLFQEPAPLPLPGKRSPDPI